MKLHRIVLAVLLAVSISSTANATVISYGSYTRDTDLGIDYLDVGILFGSYASFEAGVMYDGRLWVLATADQLASTWSDATGLTLTTSDILSPDNNMGFTATDILIGFFDGVTTDVGASGERVIGNYNTSWYANFIAGGSLSVHDQFDDSHYYGTAYNGENHGAWLVSAVTSVPDQGSALTMLAFGLLALRSIRRVGR